MHYFQIGSLSLPAIWLAVLIALFASSWLHRIQSGEKVGEWYWNGFFLYFLTWKLSYILFNFLLFLDMPLSIVYFNGGTYGHFLALALLSIYFIFLAGKKHPSIYKQASQLVLFFIILYEVTIHLLNQQWMQAILHIMIFVSLLAFLQVRKKSKQERLPTEFLLLFLMVEILILSFSISILTIGPLTILWLGATAYYLNTQTKQGGTRS
ncbi:hypothetical protein M3182_16775 [Mesobacillus maritimus]|uniref:hypothetical protein n=1 Tax=Mesobacillus maritimus TaxID=1643336 RepID=UPI00203CB580|nr:hypothetical protein [Mesobacillus maritimus]MCM3587393.1 hypothetical protein [Mesobacillus maritimus]MCM3667953.1 hypothetical protein [Mesobacillus maritimus]